MTLSVFTFCVASWKNSKHGTGTLSTSGTTALVVIIRKDNMFIANERDSTVVLGVDPAFADSESTDHASISSPSNKRGQIRAVVLTHDHKPEGEEERQRIDRIDHEGRVLTSSSGVKRVAWPQKRACNTLSRLYPERNYDVVPFLNVARSLGDLWSYTEECNDYFVSPGPGISEYKLDALTSNLLTRLSARRSSSSLWRAYDRPNCAFSRLSNIS